jgi:hypothetical protein
LLPFLLLFFFTGVKTLSSKQERREGIIAVYPLGLQQVTRDEHGRNLSEPRFWPASDILDCIVMEHIRVHAVENVVCLRIREDDRKGTISLIEAFPRATSCSYEQCLELRAQIMIALGRRTHFI